MAADEVVVVVMMMMIMNPVSLRVQDVRLAGTGREAQGERHREAGTKEAQGERHRERETGNYLFLEDALSREIPICIHRTVLWLSYHTPYIIDDNKSNASKFE